MRNIDLVLLLCFMQFTFGNRFDFRLVLSDFTPFYSVFRTKLICFGFNIKEIRDIRKKTCQPGSLKRKDNRLVKSIG